MRRKAEGRKKKAAAKDRGKKKDDGQLPLF